MQIKNRLAYPDNGMFHGDQRAEVLQVRTFVNSGRADSGAGPLAALQNAFSCQGLAYDYR